MDKIPFLYLRKPMKMQFKNWIAICAVLLVGTSLTAAPFEILFRIMKLDGACEIKRPQDSDFETALKGKAYPYGSVIRTGSKGVALLVLSPQEAVTIHENSALELLDSPGAKDEAKIVRMLYGHVSTHVDNADEPYRLVLESPVARCVALSGAAEFKLSETASDMTFKTRAEGRSSLKIIGSQFIIPALHNGYGTSITSAKDNSMSRIENLLGDYRIFINTGEKEDAPELVDGAFNTDLITIDSSSRTAVKIWRTHAKVGNRMIASVLVTDANGQGKENFAFAVGQPSVASRAVFDDDEQAATNAPPSAAAESGEVALFSDDPFAGLDLGEGDDTATDKAKVEGPAENTITDFDF